ncbi:MAG: putative toxin-antitoxin system toxin component, PIN family [bacterium]|nr:putative toxin-antitoxin system toxin component, PIN family [bacterium]
MKHVFIDTSVLFSAVNSKSGSSARVLQFCKKGKIKGSISDYVINELKKNVSSKLDQIGKQRLNFLLLQVPFHIIEEPTREEIALCEKVINTKDAPILAAAIKSKATHLISLDVSDFMKPKVREFAKPLIIISPRDFVHAYLSV